MVTHGNCHGNRASARHREYLSDAVYFASYANRDRRRFPMLAGINPIGNTLFNRFQREGLASEAETLLVEGVPDKERPALEEIVRLCATQARIRPHRFLWFVGDEDGYLPVPRSSGPNAGVGVSLDARFRDESGSSLATAVASSPTVCTAGNLLLAPTVGCSSGGAGDVPGPGATGDLLVVERGDVAVAERIGDNGRRYLVHEVVEGSVACASQVDSEVAKADHDGVRVQANVRRGLEDAHGRATGLLFEPVVIMCIIGSQLVRVRPQVSGGSVAANEQQPQRPRAWP